VLVVAGDRGGVKGTMLCVAMGARLEGALAAVLCLELTSIVSLSV
jgi:hypothetical protein